MNQAIADLSGNTLFELRLRQAILAAQHDVKQVGLLLIDIDATDNFPIQDSELAKEFSEKIWIRSPHGTKRLRYNSSNGRRRVGSFATFGCRA